MDENIRQVKIEQLTNLMQSNLGLNNTITDLMGKWEQIIKFSREPPGSVWFIRTFIDSKISAIIDFNLVSHTSFELSFFFFSKELVQGFIGFLRLYFPLVSFLFLELDFVIVKACVWIVEIWNLWYVEYFAMSHFHNRDVHGYIISCSIPVSVIIFEILEFDIGEQLGEERSKMTDHKRRFSIIVVLHSFWVIGPWVSDSASTIYEIRIS